MARRKLYPMPVEGLIDSPDFLAMPAAGAGIVIRLALHFWATDCRPMPIADHELRNIARAHAPTWRHWKPQALRVFEQIRPALERYRYQRESKATTLTFAGRRGGAALAAKSRAQVLTQAIERPQARPLPVREPATTPRPPKPADRPARPRLADRP